MENINKEKFPYYIGRLPFYYTNLDSPNNPEGVPDTLEFNLDCNIKTGTLIQKYDKKTDDFLNKAYSYGSQITGYMDSYELGAKYAQDFLSFVTKNEKNINECRILEIGCGTGYLIWLLKKIGAEVVGIEPGRQAELGKEKYNIDIIKDYYPSEQLKGKFDIIIFYNVLEHISDIKTFLINVKNQLKEDGRIYCAVPDCEDPIKNGDISMLIHEHYNYFIKETLKNTFIDSINCSPYIEKSNFGAELYGYTVNNENYCVECSNLDELYKMNIAYLKKIAKKASVFKNFLLKINEDNKTLGIYVPSRAINILSQINNNLNNIEFFDDNPNMIGKYFPEFVKKIKCRSDLINNPTDYVLIMSYTFGDIIKKNISEFISDKTIIIKYEELL